jgi:hypothetical protein
MVLPNLCFTGDHGVGKRTTLLKFLGDYARREGVPFHVKTKYLVGKLLNSVSSSNGTEASDSDSDDDGGGVAPVAAAAPDPDGKYFPFEVSAIHQGYDVARMSLQDKNYIYTIFKNFHGSSYVLSRSNYHFFVFYHAHLLSEESIIFLQEKLEQYSNCLRIFLTSNYPLPLRLADHFVEVPLVSSQEANASPQARDCVPLEANASQNHLYKSLTERFPHMAAHKEPQWIIWFEKTLALWYNAKWMASDVPAIRQWIYFCLQRNLRWCEMIEYWTLTIQRSELLTSAQKCELLHILALAEGGGGWQIIPSYRIPLLWESVLLDIIKVIGKFT